MPSLEEAVIHAGYNQLSLLVHLHNQELLVNE